MLKRGKIQLLFYCFFIAITLCITFIIFPPPYSGSFFTLLGFVLLAESIVLLLPMDFQSETWSTRILIIGSSAIIYALLVVAVTLLGAFNVPFNWLLVLHLLLLLVPGVGLTILGLMLKQMHTAVSSIEEQRRLFEELDSRVSVFNITLKGEGNKADFAERFSKLCNKISSMTKETYPNTEAITRQIISDIEAIIQEYKGMEIAVFSNKLEVIESLIELREKQSRR